MSKTIVHFPYASSWLTHSLSFASRSCIRTITNNIIVVLFFIHSLEKAEATAIAAYFKNPKSNNRRYFHSALWIILFFHSHGKGKSKWCAIKALTKLWWIAKQTWFVFSSLLFFRECPPRYQFCTQSQCVFVFKIQRSVVSSDFWLRLAIIRNT